MRRALVPLLLAASLAPSACAKPPDPPLELSAHLAPAPISASPAEAQPAGSGGPSISPSPAEAAFERHCAECHRSSRYTAKPAALAVFDLAHHGWQAGMTEAQLHAAMGRFKGMSKVTDDERDAAGQFIDAEISRRKAKSK